MVYKVVVFCSRSKLRPLETLLLGRVLWCFVREHHWGELVSLFRAERKKIEMKKEEWGREVRTEGKVPGRPHSRPVQSGEGKEDGK